METVILVIHLILALGIIGLVLLQRSEGGGLGIGGGGGGGMGGLATPHSTANALTKATQIFAALFFCTSLLLAVLAGTHSGPESLLEQLDNQPIAAEGEVAPPADANEDMPEPSVPISD